MSYTCRPYQTCCMTDNFNNVWCCIYRCLFPFYEEKNHNNCNYAELSLKKHKSKNL